MNSADPDNSTSLFLITCSNLMVETIHACSISSIIPYFPTFLEKTRNSSTKSTSAKFNFNYCSVSITNHHRGMTSNTKSTANDLRRASLKTSTSRAEDGGFLSLLCWGKTNHMRLLVIFVSESSLEMQCYTFPTKIIRAS